MKLINAIIIQIIISFLVLSLTACSDEPERPTPPLSVGRTMLVYMVASNSLGAGGFDAADLEEMRIAAEAGDITDGRLLVYHVPVSGDPVLKEITAGGTDTLAIYDSAVTSVSSARMLEVFDDMRRLAPAEDYGLVLWSHASGWLQDGIEEDTVADEAMIAPAAFGTDRGKKMNVTTLARTLQGQNFSFVYFDCCYMGAVEVAYELRNVTPLIVASPSELPSRGMPYDRNVRCFFAPEPDMVAAARNTFEIYDQTMGSERTCTMTVINTSALDRLASAIRAIYSRAALPVPAGYEPQRYMTESRCYHYDLTDYVEALCDDPDLLAEYRMAMAETVLYEDATPWLWNRLEIKTHCGLTTFIFDDAAEARMKNYNTTSWFGDVASELLN